VAQSLGLPMAALAVAVHPRALAAVFRKERLLQPESHKNEVAKWISSVLVNPYCTIKVSGSDCAEPLVGVAVTVRV
jgi:hypothetical protein